MKNFRVVKILGGEILVTDGDQILHCVKSGNIKKGDKLCVGDFVSIKANENSIDEYVVCKILPRKNMLLRPHVSNIDNLIIVVSPSPQPDFYLVDNLILYSIHNDINPVLVFNKCDLISSDQMLKLSRQYNNVVDDIIFVSAKEGTRLDRLRCVLSGKFSALAGQSAVGKSSIINSLCPDLKLKLGELSEKISRGKHTTRHHEIFKFDDIMIADTPGFSMFDVIDIKFDDLHSYYADFAPFEDDCKFGGCTHINCSSHNCGVVKAVENGQICLERYQRYCKIYSDLKNLWRQKYD